MPPPDALPVVRQVPAMLARLWEGTQIRAGYFPGNAGRVPDGAPRSQPARRAGRTNLV